MPRAKQFTVSCENRPGALAHIANVLGEARVNILALLTGTSGTEGWVRFIADKPGKAKQALDRAGLPHTQKAVLHVELRNVPGELGRFAGKLADKGINITGGYETAVKGARKASVVLSVSDLGAAARQKISQVQKARQAKKLKGYAQDRARLLRRRKG